eukprot:scaffold5.g894.t1
MQSAAAPLARGGRGSGGGIGEARKSQFRGVQWDKNGGKWRARIHTDKTRHIGYYETEEEAAEAWDMAALRHFGATAVAKLNFPASADKFEAMASAATTGGSGSLDAGASGAALGGAAPPAAAAAGGSAGALVGGAAGAPAYRGVAPLDGRWKATVQHRRSQVLVGVFDSAEEAARAYDRENLRLNGRGAITNFPLLDYTAELHRLHSEHSLPVGSGTGREATPCSLGGAARSMRPSPYSALGTPGGSYLPASGGGARKRPRGEASRVASGAGGSESETESPASAAGRAAPGLVGVRRLANNRWQASLSVDLGVYGTSAEAARAHDRAALQATGLTSRLNQPLAEAVAQLAASAAAAGGSPPGVPTPGQAAPPPVGGGERGGAPGQLRGVAIRGGSYIAMLDIAGKSYELGPFPSEAEAARAYDRYSVLLHGVRAETNHPVFEYWAQVPEVQSLVEATLVVEAANRVAAAQAAAAEAAVAAVRQPLRRGSSEQLVAAAATAAAPAQLAAGPPQPAHVLAAQGTAAAAVPPFQMTQQQAHRHAQQAQQQLQLQQHFQAQQVQQQQQQQQLQMQAMAVAAAAAQQAQHPVASVQAQAASLMGATSSLDLQRAPSGICMAPVAARVPPTAPLSAAQLPAGTTLTLGTAHPLGLVFAAGQAPQALHQQAAAAGVEGAAAGMPGPFAGATTPVGGLVLPTPQPVHPTQQQQQQPPQ